MKFSDFKKTKNKCINRTANESCYFGTLVTHSVPFHGILSIDQRKFIARIWFESLWLNILSTVNAFKVSKID